MKRWHFGMFFVLTFLNALAFSTPASDRTSDLILELINEKYDRLHDDANHRVVDQQSADVNGGPADPEHPTSSGGLVFDRTTIRKYDRFHDDANHRVVDQKSTNVNGGPADPEYPIASGGLVFGHTTIRKYDRFHDDANHRVVDQKSTSVNGGPADPEHPTSSEGLVFDHGDRKPTGGPEQADPVLSGGLVYHSGAKNIQTKVDKVDTLNSQDFAQSNDSEFGSGSAPDESIPYKMFPHGVVSGGLEPDRSVPDRLDSNGQGQDGSVSSVEKEFDKYPENANFHLEGSYMEPGHTELEFDSPPGHDYFHTEGSYVGPALTESELTDMQPESLNFGSVASIARLLKCIYTEVTIPSSKRLRKYGAKTYAKYLLDDTVKGFIREANLIPRSSGPDEMDVDIERRLQLCVSGKSINENPSEGRDYGGGYGSHGGGHGNTSILGFALLGLKVVGGLAAFLFWDLNNT